MVLTNTDQPLNLLQQAVNRLAQEQYAAAIKAFYAKPNWALLATQLDQVAQRFPRDWPGAMSTRLLASMAKSRSTQPQPTPPKLEGPLASAENIALLTRLATEAPLTSRAKPESKEAPEEAIPATDEEDAGDEETDDISADEDSDEPAARPDQPRPLWFLHPPSAEKFKGPLQEILAKGLDAIPLLTACLNDTTLSAVERPYWSYSYRYRDSSDTANVSTLPTTTEEILTELQYSHVQRPAMLHELAEPWLKALFGSSDPYESDNDEDEAGPDLKTRSLEFYQKWKSQPPLTVLWHYLDNQNKDQSGDSDMHVLAMKEILKTAPDEVPKLEAWLLKEPLLSKFDVIARYVQLRGQSAESFLTTFSTQARKEVKQEELREGSRFNSSLADAQKELESELKKLEAQIHGTGITDLVNDIVSGKIPTRKAAEALSEIVGGKPPTEQHVNDIMAAASKAETADAHASLINLLTTLQYMSRGSEKFSKWTKNTPEKLKTWEGWLQDERPLSFHATGLGPAKLGLCAATLGNNLASSMKDQSDQMLAYAAGYARNGEIKDDFLTRPHQGVVWKGKRSRNLRN